MSDMEKEKENTSGIEEENKEMTGVDEEAPVLGEETKGEVTAEETEEAVADAAEADEDICGGEETCEGEETGEGEKEKLSWSQKRAAKKQDALKEQIEQLEDRVKRQMAEFENFRKRTDKEKQAMFDMGAKSVLEKILPVVDNFERGLQTVEPEKTEDPFVDGMNRIYKQLLTEMENLGVKPIEALGCEFDPNLHNAVMQVESEEYESGVIAQELQKGYTYHDTVIRHSMVAVVK